MLYREIDKIVLFCSVLVGFSSFLMASNGSDMYILDGYTDSDVAEVVIQENHTECKASIESTGKLLDTTCINIKNSKNIQILCTPNKKMCKTLNEVVSFVMNGSRAVQDNIITSDFEKKSTLSASKELTWKDLGIGVINPGDITDWTYFGTKTPKEAAEWIDALKPLEGISFAGATRIWKQNGFEVKEVKEWVRLGARNPEWAKRWIEAGASNTQEVHQWKNIGINTANELSSWTYNNIKTPERVYAWLEVGVHNTKDLRNWLKSGVHSPNKVKKWRKIGINDYKEVDQWRKMGFENPIEVEKWIDAGIGDINEVEVWKRANVHTLDEVQAWKSIGINDGGICREWKRYVNTPENAKEWMDASYTLNDVASQVSNGNFSPADVKSSFVKNIFWLIILAIIGVFVYRALQLKCPKCKSRNYTEIDSQENLVGYERYAKKGDNYTKIKGLHDTRGKHTKVNAIYDVQKTYRCDDCGHVFKNRTKNTEAV